MTMALDSTVQLCMITAIAGVLSSGREFAKANSRADFSDRMSRGGKGLVRAGIGLQGMGLAVQDFGVALQ